MEKRRIGSLLRKKGYQNVSVIDSASVPIGTRILADRHLRLTHSYA